MSGVWSDIRFGLHLAARSPVFTLTVALLLGLGIGANTLIFSVLDTLLLRPLPVNHPEQLVRVVEVHPTGFVTWSLPYDLCQPLAQASTMSESLCQGELDVAFEDHGATERVRVNAVSGNFFPSLGIRAQIGRVLLAGDDLQAVVSYDFWQKQLAGAVSVVGQKIILNRQPFTVVGVLPRGVKGLTVETSPDIRVPIAGGWLLEDKPGGKPADHFFVPFQVFGRLRPGVTLERAEAEIDPLLRVTIENAEMRAFPDLAKRPRSELFNWRLRLESAGKGVSTLRAQFSRGLLLLMAGVGLLLLMACANVGCLLLARSAARSQEIAVRLALGAGRWRVARQFLTESLVLAAAGGVVGVVLAWFGRPLLLAALPPIRDRAAVVQPLAVHLDIDLRVLGFALLVTLLTAVLFGLMPAIRAAREEFATSLRGTRSSSARQRGRNILVAVQVSVCVLLVAGASLLVDTFERMRLMDAGFDRDHIVTFTIDPGLKGYPPDRAKLLSRQLLERTRPLAGTVAAALASRGLMRGTGIKTTFAAAGMRISKQDFLNTSLNSVTPGYFDAMGMRIVAGRDFTALDDAKQKPAGRIVNQAFARRFFPGQDAVGKLFGQAGAGGLAAADNQIIGVVSDSRYRSLREPIPPTVYSPVTDGFDGSFILHLRTRGDPASAIAPVREVLRRLDPELPLVEVRTLAEEVDASLWQERLLAWLSGVFGCFAALLAAIGLYGAVDFAVRSRTREIGIRVALGADPLRVVRLLSRETLVVVTAGIVVGVVLCAAGTRWIRPMLDDSARSEIPAVASALLFIAVVALCAAAPPIWRAVRIDPASALRHE